MKRNDTIPRNAIPLDLGGITFAVTEEPREHRRREDAGAGLAGWSRNIANRTEEYVRPEHPHLFGDRF